MGEFIDALKDGIADRAEKVGDAATARAEKLAEKIAKPIGSIKGDPLGSVGKVAKKGWNWTGGGAIKAAKWGAIAGVGLIALNALAGRGKKKADSQDRSDDLALAASGLPQVDVPAQAVLPPIAPTLMGETPQPGRWAATVRGGAETPAYQPPGLDSDLASRTGDVSTQPSRA